ncbi:MAG: triosephosphate isomerase [Nitriliruptoraceae bacterium]|nr:triosephosphate isomerase [Nitriliruptoraceae bacterium]
MSEPARPLVGVGLKMYLGFDQTLTWVDALVDCVGRHNAVESGAVDLFVLPDFVSLSECLRRVEGTRVVVGAQDVSPEAPGPFTGDVSAPTLREVGCRYVEIGHAERRRGHGEDDQLVARKAVAAVRAGITPVLCVGERARGPVEAAVGACHQQLEPVLEAVQRESDPISAELALVIAYEPEWAIGAPAPAGHDHIRGVAGALRDQAAAADVPVRLLYGGSAGPGIATALWPSVDGLFLGRSAHDVRNVELVLDELTATARTAA